MKYGVPAGLGAAVLLVMGAAQSSTAYEIKPKQPNHERLTAMAERAKLMNGTLGIQTEPGRGTTITIQVPA